MGSRIVIVGCGIFGITAALELRRRGHEVRVLEAFSPPAPNAASTDISKVVRLEYGLEPTYTALAERSLDLWLEWNQRWQRDGRPKLFHEVGLLLICRDEMSPGGFEHDSYQTLRARGHSPERLGGRDLAERFPAWSPSFADGFFHAKGGYVESAGVVWALAEEARVHGVEILPRTPARRVAHSAGQLAGVEDGAGVLHAADRVVLAVGSWTEELVPRLAESLRRNDQPVWHLRPARPELFRAELFPVFSADIARTGYYGFPLHPVHAVVKMGHHGDPVERADWAGAEAAPSPQATERLREFLAGAIPSLADAEVVYSKLCPYCDTADEHFWIAADPEFPELTVAAGGSGHAFKFAPLLGEIIADTVEGKEHPQSELFRWRPDQRLAQGFEPSRCRDEPA